MNKRTEMKKKVCLAILLCIGTTRRVNRKRWVKEWLEKREKYTHLNFLREISVTSAEDDYRNYFRMNEVLFKQLLTMVNPYLTIKNTYMRDSLTVEERLSLTLRFLATGRSFEDLKFSVVMSPSAISKAVLETCETLIFVLREYIQMPHMYGQWIQIADDFGNKFNFWNCLGALDEKHIAIKKPAMSGSAYFNYKGFHSIVLLALINAKKEFIMVDVGINGRISHGGVLFHSKFSELFQRNELNLPPPTPIPDTTDDFPFFFIGDEAFALSINLMKPYSQKTLTAAEAVFNRRLSSARSVVENAFGIISCRFGVLGKPINLEPNKAAIITKTCCYLHNFLIRESAATYFPLSIESPQVCRFSKLQRTSHRNVLSEAKDLRNELCQYYCNQRNTPAKLDTQ